MYKIGYIKATESSNVDNIFNVFSKNNISYNRSEIVYDTHKSFNKAIPPNIKISKHIGHIHGTFIESVKDLYNPNIPLVPQNEGTSNRPSFSYSYTASDGNIYGSFASTDGIYKYDPITNETKCVYASGLRWSIFHEDSKGNIYVSGTQNYSAGIVVIVKDIGYLVHSKGIFYGFFESSLGEVYISSYVSGCPEVFYIHIENDTPIATIIGKTEGQGRTKYYETSRNDIYLLGIATYHSGIVRVTPTALYKYATSIKYVDRILESSNGTIYVCSSSSSCPGIYVITRTYEETLLSTTGYAWTLYPVNDEGIVILSSTKILIVDSYTILHEYSYSVSMCITYNGYTYITSSTGVYVLEEDYSLYQLYGSSLRKTASVYLSTGEIYLISTENYLYVYYLFEKTFTVVNNGAGRTATWDWYVAKDETIYLSSNTAYHYRGLGVATPTKLTSILGSMDEWNIYKEDSKGNVYISRSSMNYVDDLSNSGLYLARGTTITRICDGYNWKYMYETKTNNVYLSSGDANSGILKVDGANVKRIWDRSVSFKYVQETPNGLLVADTEFIGPDDKILYIKGDRVMETSINEINAYNKEANNE